MTKTNLFKKLDISVPLAEYKKVSQYKEVKNADPVTQALILDATTEVLGVFEDTTRIIEERAEDELMQLENEKENAIKKALKQSEKDAIGKDYTKKISDLEKQKENIFKKLASEKDSAKIQVKYTPSPAVFSHLNNKGDGEKNAAVFGNYQVIKKIGSNYVDYLAGAEQLLVGKDKSMQKTVVARKASGHQMTKERVDAMGEHANYADTNDKTRAMNNLIAAMKNEVVLAQSSEKIKTNKLRNIMLTIKASDKIDVDAGTYTKTITPALYKEPWLTRAGWSIMKGTVIGLVGAAVVGGAMFYAHVHSDNAHQETIQPIMDQVQNNTAQIENNTNEINTIKENGVAAVMENQNDVLFYVADAAGLKYNGVTIPADSNYILSNGNTKAGNGPCMILYDANGNKLDGAVDGDFKPMIGYENKLIHKVTLDVDKGDQLKYMILPDCKVDVRNPNTGLIFRKITNNNDNVKCGYFFRDDANSVGYKGTSCDNN